MKPNISVADRNPACSIIVPCYNAAAFLENSINVLEKFLESYSRYEVIFIDDASTDQTSSLLRSCCESSNHRSRLSWYSQKTNQGKGAAILLGMQHVRGEIVCFTDADLSYAPHNIVAFEAALEPNTLLIANRVDPASVYLIQPRFFRFIALRHLSSRVFNSLINLVLSLKTEDVQAGLKMAYRKDFRKCVTHSRLMRFSFDSELLYLANKKGIRISQQPVEFTYQHESSSVGLFRDGLIMILDLFKIRAFDWFGRYL